MRRPKRIRSLATALLAIFAATAAAACDDGLAIEPPNPTFRIEVSGERFTVEVVTDAQVQEIEARLESGEEGVIIGDLVAGDAGYNTPWSWHLDPSTVHAVDASIELCDGRPSMVEENLTYWLDSVERFCPWGARVVERIR